MTVLSHRRWRTCLAVLLVIALVAPGAPVHAQEIQGTTITVLQGELALVRTDGSALQPVPSGTEIGPGDELRAVSAGGASVRIVDGLEMDLTQGTIIMFGGLVREGARTNVLVSQIQGGSETFVAFL